MSSASGVGIAVPASARTGGIRDAKPADQPITSPSTRRTYLDVLRGVAVLIMIEAHVIDSWTREADRHSRAFYTLSERSERCVVATSLGVTSIS